MFDQILNALNVYGKGSQGYSKAIAVARECMKSDPNQAAGYLLLVVQAEQFIENTGRLAITSVQTDHAYDGFVSNATSLKQAYETQDPSAVLAALNTIAKKVLEPLGS